MRLLRHSRRVSGTLALVGVLMLAGAPVALGVFKATKVGGPTTIATAELAAAGQVEAAQVKCRANKSPEIEISWSATTSSYATSYVVERATSSNGSFSTVATLALTQTSYTDSSGSLNYTTTYYYRVSTKFHSWSTVSAQASAKTLNKSCA